MSIDQKTLTHLALAWDDITQTPDVMEYKYGHMGMWCVEYDDCDYAIDTEAVATKAVTEYIRERLWAFRPDFLERFAPDGVDADMIKHMIGDRCEDANDQVTRLVGNRLDDLVDEAISEDGIGHFLNSYDDDYKEVTTSGGNKLIVVRVN